MEQIFNIPDYGEVRLSLKEYNDMRDRIRKLEEDTDILVEERDEICEENKVRIQTVRGRKRNRAISMTYFVKGYGYNESGTTKDFSCVFDLDDVNAKTFMAAVEKASGLSPFRREKEIVIERVVVL